MGHQVYGSLAGRGGASLPSSASRSYDSSAAFPSSRNNAGSSLMESWISRDISSSGAAHSASRYMLGESGYSGAANRLSGAPGGGSGNVSSYDFNSSGITHHDQHHKHTSAAMDRYLSREIAAKPYSSGLYNGANTEALYAQKQHFQAPSSIVSTSQQQLAPWNSLSVSVTSHALPAVAGTKRPSEDVSQPILGSHILGQSDALSFPNTLNKRPRTESMGDLPIYPQRPGEKDCKYYMITRTCKFGAQCKFDHPLWVPPGGLPDWKEVPSVTNNEPLPERPGEPECTFYMKTGLCKYGGKCKFHHPKDRGEIAQGSEDKSAEQSSEVTACDSLPQRPGEQECSFFIRTGVCKYGAKCKFDHPKGRQGSQNEDHKKINEDSAIVGKPEHQKVNEDSATAGETGDAVTREKEDNGLSGESVKLEKNEATFKPATVFNSKGLPIRPGETDCAFYMKTGSCKYGELCRYNHPDRKIHVPATVMPVLTPTQPLTAFPGVVNPTQSLTSFQGVVAPSQSLTAFPLLLHGNELGATVLPQRPGQPDCSFYIKNGKCDYGANCKFHHPLDRPDSSVKLTLAGLPRREGATICAFYLKTGVCKYKANCKFDHPPPGEIEAARTQAPVKLTAAGLPRREDEATCEFYMQTGTCKLGVSCKFDHPPPGEAAAKALANTIVTKETDGMIQGRRELEGDGTK